MKLCHERLVLMNLQSFIMASVKPEYSILHFLKTTFLKEQRRKTTKKNFESLITTSLNSWPVRSEYCMYIFFISFSCNLSRNSTLVMFSIETTDAETIKLLFFLE